MTALMLDDDWVQITGDDYSNDEDEYGTKIIGKAMVIFPSGETYYFGYFEPEYEDDEWQM